MNFYQLYKMGFRYMDSPFLCNQERIKFNTKVGQFRNVVYAILINDSLQYIGVAKDFYKRTHTYRNARYWKNAFPSNKKKTKLLEKAVKNGKQVDFYCLECDNPVDEEIKLIKEFKPAWNLIYTR